MLVDEKFLLLQPVRLDPEIRALVFQQRGKKTFLNSWSQVDCDLLWSDRELVYYICPRKMPVLRFAFEILRAEEKPGVISQNTRFVST